MFREQWECVCLLLEQSLKRMDSGLSRGPQFQELLPCYGRENTLPPVSKLEKPASLWWAYGVSPCLMKTQKSPVPCSSRSHMMGSRWSMELSIPDIIDDIRENKKELSILTLSSPSLSLPLSFFSPLFPLSSSFSRNHIFME